MSVGACEHYAACKERIDGIERRVDDHDRRLREQGESLAALRAQVAMWAAIGALAGGGIVSVVANMISK